MLFALRDTELKEHLNRYCCRLYYQVQVGTPEIVQI